jgi:uncharacterized membrane protein
MVLALIIIEIVATVVLGAMCYISNSGNLRKMVNDDFAFFALTPIVNIFVFIALIIYAPKIIYDVRKNEEWKKYEGTTIYNIMNERGY